MDELIAASPALGDEDSEESGTCPKHPNGNRWSFYDRHVADMTWHCWDCLEEYVAALRARVKELEAEAKEQALHDVEQAGVRYLLTLYVGKLEKTLFDYATNWHRLEHGWSVALNDCTHRRCMETCALQGGEAGE